MTSSELGFVYSTMLKYRLVTDNPHGRAPHKDESDAAHILSNCNESDLLDFDEFLNSQGLALHIIDGIDIGIPPRPRMSNKHYILIKKRGVPLAPCFNSKWFIEEMVDKRKSRGDESLEANRIEVIFWFARLWLTMQWFFYEKISRQPSQVSHYSRALLLTERFVDVVSEGIEKMGNEGRPANEAGIMFDTLWKGRQQVKTWVKRFLRVMVQSGIIEETKVSGEYCQTLTAAVDMAKIAERELAYLMPPSDESDITKRSIMLLNGSSMPVSS